MKKIDLIYNSWTRDKSPRKYNNNHAYVPNLDMEQLYIDIIEKVRNKEKVYVKFSDSHEKRAGAIALVNRITGDEFSTRSYKNYFDETETFYEDYRSDLYFHLKWDDRKNTSKIKIINLCPNDLVYLPDYKGPTVWSMFDVEEYIEKNKKPVCDRLGRELSKNDTVVFINSRYGTGANLDLGVIRDIKNKVIHDSYRGISYIENIVVIEMIAVDDNAPPTMSKIKQSERSIIKLTNDDNLFDTAFIKKLTITQS